MVYIISPFGVTDRPRSVSYLREGLSRLAPHTCPYAVVLVCCMLFWFDPCITEEDHVLFEPFLDVGLFPEVIPKLALPG